MKSIVKLSVWVLILLPVVLLLAVAYHFTETLFYADDFHLLKTIVWAQDTDSVVEKFQLLVQQHNEHRILVPRLLTWLNYKLVGHIHWPSLMLLGNLLWCGVLYFLYDAFRTLRLSLWYFLPIPWLLFQPAYYDNYSWTISVLQQSVIVFLLAWLVHAFVNRHFLLAIFIFLIGTFTHGNGIFGIVVGVIFLVLYKEWKLLWIWLAVCLTTAAFYFYGFEKGQNADFLSSLSNPLQLLGYFLAFFGATAEIFGLGSWLSVVCGGVAFGGIVWFGFPKIYAHYFSGRSLSYFEKMLLGNLLFLGITALLVAVSRSWSSPELDIPPRNAHYSPYLISWFYLVGLAALHRATATYWALTWGIAAFAFNLLSHLNYTADLEYRRNWLRADFVNWQNYGTFVQYPPSFNDNIRDVYNTALNRGICLPSPLLSALPASKSTIDSSIVLDFEKVTAGITDATDQHIEKELLVIDHHFSGTVPYLVLVPENGAPILMAFYKGRNAYRKILSEGILRKPEIWTRFPTDNLPAGLFQLGYRTDDALTLTKYRLKVSNDHAVELL